MKVGLSISLFFLSHFSRHYTPLNHLNLASWFLYVVVSMFFVQFQPIEVFSTLLINEEAGEQGLDVSDRVSDSEIGA